ncbi:efflux RND transporter periplasmic adaptor subunit [Achromobacter sp. GG226]|uniref:efflux RND transporter periplasmic adaptor subunit n=1 Tax=Verticiella alkaliphila TaxID=2779529 RepID=UPI001C0B6BD2|nr:efflux RND transporter periplasmic adaptor subunit [Verticiella sp. GG226]MBU4611767.1 efflux RND transporter periplasmic adaptor subunit [Verticiella sp. GG226]
MKMERRRRLGALWVLTFSALTGCGRAGEAPVVAPRPLVAVMTVTPARLVLTEDLPGRVAPVRVAEIRPQVSGIVRKRLFEQGADVRAGQPLFEIDSAALRAEAQSAVAALQRAEAAASRASTRVERMAPLVQADAVSRQTYDDAVAERQQAVADVAQARATLSRRRLDLTFATVETPISGRIDQALVTEGALVASGDTTPMARVQQIDQVYVDVRRPAASWKVLREAMAAESSQAGLPVAILKSDGTVHKESGRILFSGINVDAGTGDLLVRVLVNNPQQHLLPGMFVRARLPLVSYDDALTVPQQAVVRIEGKPHVWTVDDSAKAQLTGITLGELTQGRYRVASGLRAGQNVVVAGMDRLAEDVEVRAEALQTSMAAASTTSIR